MHCFQIPSVREGTLLSPESIWKIDVANYVLAGFYHSVNFSPYPHPGIDALLQTKAQLPFDKTVIRQSKLFSGLIPPPNPAQFFACTESRFLLFSQYRPGAVNTAQGLRAECSALFLFSFHRAFQYHVPHWEETNYFTIYSPRRQTENSAKNAQKCLPHRRAIPSRSARKHLTRAVSNVQFECH